MKNARVIRLIGLQRWKRFGRADKRLLCNVAEAKRLLDQEFSGMHSDALCDALSRASEELERILCRLEPSK